MFKKLDKDRSGFISIVEVFGQCLPKVPSRDLNRLFQLDLTTEVIELLRKSFGGLSSRGNIDWKKLKDAGEKMMGMRLSMSQLKAKYHSENVSFNEVLMHLYPSIPPELMERYLATDIAESEFVRLREGFDSIDKDGSGSITAQEFNRGTQSGGKSKFGDWIRMGSTETAGGMKFDMQIFNRIDKDRSGEITFMEMLKAFYPSVPDIRLRKYIKMYGKAGDGKFAQDRAQLEQEEEEQRRYVENEEDSIRQELLQLYYDETLRAKEMSLGKFRERLARERLEVELEEDKVREMVGFEEAKEWTAIILLEGQQWAHLVGSLNPKQPPTIAALEEEEAKGRWEIERLQEMRWHYLTEDLWASSLRAKFLQTLQMMEHRMRCHLEESQWYDRREIADILRFIGDENKERTRLEHEQEGDRQYMMCKEPFNLKLMPKRKRQTQSYLMRLLHEQEDELSTGAFTPHGVPLERKHELQMSPERLKPGKLLQSLHSANIACVTYSPDGSRILSSDDQAQIREWDAKSGMLIKLFTGHNAAVTSVTYSPDGSRVLSGSADTTIKEWDAFTGGLLQTLTGHGSALSCVTYSPDGAKILSCGANGIIKEWTAGTGQLLQTLTSTASGVPCISYSPAGKSIVSCNMDGSIQQWDTNPAPTPMVEAKPFATKHHTMPSAKTHRITVNYCRYCSDVARHNVRAQEVLKSLQPVFPQFNYVLQGPVTSEYVAPLSHQKYSDAQAAGCNHFFVYFTPSGYEKVEFTLLGPDNIKDVASVVHSVQNKLRDFPLPNLFVSVSDYIETFIRDSPAVKPNSAYIRHLFVKISLGMQNYTTPSMQISEPKDALSASWDLQSSTFGIWASDPKRDRLSISVWYRCGAVETHLGEGYVALDALYSGPLQSICVKFAHPGREDSRLTVLLKATRGPFLPEVGPRPPRSAPPRFGAPPSRKPGFAPLPLRPASAHTNNILFTEDQISDLFRQLDRSGRGYLRYDEFTALYKSFDNMGLDEADDVLEQELKHYNFLGDGKLSFDEFMILMLKIARR